MKYFKRVVNICFLKWYAAREGLRNLPIQNKNLNKYHIHLQDGLTVIVNHNLQWKSYFRILINYYLY